MSGFFPLTYSIADIAMFFCVYSHTPNNPAGSSHFQSNGCFIMFCQVIGDSCNVYEDLDYSD
ncbi:AVN_HP_G0120140.mRNA.1.CDS.1 [Saccharomyces cerevisiae]|nr:AVN_HP_G0120140.mRNA.1.CDS.1 [Saccharomyces cerevisiae]CAI6997223.1 AVN_HP_G0120140.mRNA.1.CDS.1 [Saccharomyces cerevisiae]